MFKRSMVLGYICLVGIPLLVLVAILDAGHDLVAPMPIAGTWDVRADLPASSASPCPGALSGRPLVLDISQSGMYLDLSLEGRHGSGMLQNANLTAGLSRSAEDRSCGTANAAISLRATVGGPRDHYLLAGSMGVEGCAACAAVPFTAVRRAAAGKTSH